MSNKDTMYCTTDVWLRNPLVLFCDFSMIPLTSMSTSQQVNAMTRLTVAISIILLLLDFRYTLQFLVLSLAFIIIFYLSKTNKGGMFNRKESFTQDSSKPSYSAMMTSPDPRRQTVSYSIADAALTRVAQTPDTGVQIGIDDTPGLKLPSAYRYCNDSVPLNYNDPNYTSPNQKLVGKPNPKTLIAPVVVPPTHDLGFWKANNLVTHSAVNEDTQYDAYQSGEVVSTCCGFMENKYLVPADNPVAYAVNLDSDPQMSCKNKISNQHKGVRLPYESDDVKEPGQSALSRSHHPRKPGSSNLPMDVKETFSMFPFNTTGVQDGTEYRNAYSGEMDVACGYNPQQLYSAGLPTNYSAGNCEQHPDMKQYNENLFTQTVMPGVYTRSEITEPIDSNMGISFTQQLPPTTCQTNPDTGDVFYTEHDPRLNDTAVVEPNLATAETFTRSDIYDPRHTGYGTSYRSYIDEMTGQPRFYYDDVDVVTMPNYITRSNIDFVPFADHYGPAPSEEAWGNKFNPEIRALANDTFLRNSIEQRTSIAQSAMRKNNAVMWQRRKAPIRTGGQRMLGGVGSGK